MRFNLSILSGCTALVAVAVTALGMTSAQAGPPGEKIQFSEPSNPTVASNLNRLDPRQSTFKQVEEDLFKPFKLGNQLYNRDAIISIPPPPQMTPSVPDKRTQDLIERRKNWAFTDWSDLFPDPSMEELSNKEGLDGKQKKSVSLIDRFYESLDQKRSSATNRMNSSGRFNQDFAGTNVLDPSGESFTPEGQFNKIMKHIFNPASADEADKSVIDFNHSNLRPLTPEQVQDQKRRFEEFQQLLDPHPVAITPANPANPANPGVQAGVYDPANQFNSTPQHRNPVNPSMGVVDPTAKAFYSHVYDDPTALALGQTNNLLTPRPATSLVPPSSLQSFDSIPKRKF